MTIQELSYRVQPSDLCHRPSGMPSKDRPFGPKRQCVVDGCSTMLNMGNRSGYCQPHQNECPAVKLRKRAFEVTAMERMWAERGECRECGKKLPASNESGFCQRHRHLSPARQEARGAFDAAYYQQNADKWLDHGHVRRARKRAALVEYVDRNVVWERDGGICHICSLPADPAKWELDHIRPLARGGEHSYANTAVSHRKCNRSKGSHYIEEVVA